MTWRLTFASCTALFVGTLLLPVVSAGDGHDRPGIEARIGASDADIYFYTTYHRDTDKKTLHWTTCGESSQEIGCFGGGDLGPFGHPCAVAGSAHRLVVLDSNGSANATTMYVYKQVESATPSVTLLRTIALPDIPASRTARCHLGILGNYAYAGTSESYSLYKVDLSAGSTALLGMCDGNTSAITANDKYLIVSKTYCYQGFLPNGQLVQGGSQLAGDNEFITNSTAVTF